MGSDAVLGNETTYNQGDIVVKLHGLEAPCPFVFTQDSAASSLAGEQSHPIKIPRSRPTLVTANTPFLELLEEARSEAKASSQPRSQSRWRVLAEHAWACGTVARGGSVKVGSSSALMPLNEEDSQLVTRPLPPPRPRARRSPPETRLRVPSSSSSSSSSPPS